MATGIKAHKKYYTSNGVPTKQEIYQSTGQYPSLYEHLINRNGSMGNRWYFWNGTIFAPDPELNEQEKATGTSAAPTVKVGTTTTGQPGTPAQVTDSDPSGNLILDFIIPQGIKGDPGTGGGGSGAAIVVTPNGTDDTANLQSAINQSYSTGRPIELYGTYYISSGLTFNKEHELVIIGNRAKIRTKNTTAYTMLSSSVANMTEADLAVHRMIHVDKVTFYGSPTQKGIEPGPGYGCTFTNLKFYGLGHALHLRFSLHAKVTNCQAINCNDGFTADYGNWTGATISNSQSNHTQFEGCRIYMP